MISRETENIIINLIQSLTVKEQIKKLNYRFSEIDLVKIVMEFEPNFQEEIKYLDELDKQVENSDVRIYIHRVIDLLNKEYQLLIEEEKDFVYEVKMDQDSQFERYLCPNFEAALITSQKYQQKYKENCSIIEVVKRRVAIRNTEVEIDNNEEPVTAFLDGNNHIISISSNLPRPQYEDLSINMDAIHYPSIFKKGDFVFYYNNRYGMPHFSNNLFENQIMLNGEKIYGINCYDNTQTTSEEGSQDYDVSCFLYLDSEFVEKRTVSVPDERGHYPYLMNHWHIDYGYIEKCDINETSESIVEDYQYVIKELEKMKW